MKRIGDPNWGKNFLVTYYLYRFFLKAVPDDLNHSHKKWEQFANKQCGIVLTFSTRVYQNPDLRTCIKTNKQQKITFYNVTKSHKLFICEGHFTVDQIYVYSSRKSLKEGALPTMNLPHPSANAKCQCQCNKLLVKEGDRKT